ncbi:hypothetical protein CR513_07014, partial [Mucuna pruriens]
MYQYVAVQDMVHQTIKVKQQLKRINSLKKNSNSSSFSWKNNSKKEVVGSHSKLVDSKKNQIEAKPSKNQDIKCFKCLGRGHIASHDDNKELPHDVDLLIVRRVLNMQKKKKER